MSKQDTPAKPTRRRHSADVKRELVERCLQPGTSVSAIALENGINANVLFRWRRMHVRARGAEQAVLLPVNVSAQEMAVHAGRKPAMAAVPAGVIEIDIGSARVRLRGAVDEVNVRCVLQALSSLA